MFPADRTPNLFMPIRSGKVLHQITLFLTFAVDDWHSVVCWIVNSFSAVFLPFKEDTYNVNLFFANTPCYDDCNCSSLLIRFEVLNNCNNNFIINVDNGSTCFWVWTILLTTCRIIRDKLSNFKQILQESFFVSFHTMAYNSRRWREHLFCCYRC